MRVTPPGRRSIVRSHAEGLEITFPAKRNILLMLFLTAWLGGWAMGEVFAVRELFVGGKAGPRLFLMFWLAGWTVGGGLAIYTWFWMAAGREIVTLRPSALTIRRQVFGMGRTREFALPHVSNLRVAPALSDPWGASMRSWGAGGGLVAFDYGAKTFRFGDSIDEAEAAQVVRDLSARHSFRGAA